MPQGKPFEKGRSPNPGGRPAGYAEFRALCRTKSDAAVGALVAALANPDTSVPAARVILEFAWGKPVQPVEGADGGPIRVIVQSIAPAEKHNAK